MNTRELEAMTRTLEKIDDGMGMFIKKLKYFETSLKKSHMSRLKLSPRDKSHAESAELSPDSRNKSCRIEMNILKCPRQLTRPYQ